MSNIFNGNETGNPNFDVLGNVNNSTISSKSSNRCWERFIELSNSGSKVQDEPRRQVHLDADLHKSLMELDINDLRLCDKINFMLRAFMESHMSELLQFRKPITKSIFDNYKSNGL